MNQEQTSEQKINLLLNVINSTIKLPKITEVMENKKLVPKLTGSVEISLLNNESIEVLRGTILNELVILYPHLAPKAPEVIENAAQIPLEFKEEEIKTND